MRDRLRTAVFCEILRGVEGAVGDERRVDQRHVTPYGYASTVADIEITLCGRLGHHADGICTALLDQCHVFIDVLRQKRRADGCTVGGEGDALYPVRFAVEPYDVSTLFHRNASESRSDDYRIPRSTCFEPHGDLVKRLVTGCGAPQWWVLNLEAVSYTPLTLPTKAWG